MGVETTIEALVTLIQKRNDGNIEESKHSESSSSDDDLLNDYVDEDREKEYQEMLMKAAADSQKNASKSSDIDTFLNTADLKKYKDCFL